MLAQTPNDLNDKASFERGWSGLTDKMGTNLDVAEVVIRPETIEIEARAEAGGARIDHERVGSRTVLSMTFHMVSGPQREQPSSPVANVENGLFAISSVPLDRFWTILDAARARVRLDDPGRISAVRIGRVVTLLPNPAFGDVRRSITVSSDRESASVTTATDGRLVQTVR